MEYFGTDLTSHGHYYWNIDEGMYKIYTPNDIPFNPECLTKNLAKGQTVFYRGGGYTVLGISGSCKDERPGTKSVFWVKELLTKHEITDMVLSNSMAMKMISSMPFKVEW